MRHIEYSRTRSGQPARRHAASAPRLPPWRRRGAAGSARRTATPPDCPPFELDRDLRTREITTGIAQRLLDLTGEAPSVVIAEYDREYIDANRLAACAFEPVQAV
jgi:hypothetical protein